MKPAPQDIELYRGDKFTCFFRVRAQNSDGTAGDYVDLTGYVPKAQIRADPDAVAVLAEFGAVLGDQSLFPGSVLLTLLSAQTTSLTLPTGGGVWDAQITLAGEPRTVLAGKVTMIKDVTHA